jgi:hypothetical protein
MVDWGPCGASGGPGARDSGICVIMDLNSYRQAGKHNIDLAPFDSRPISHCTI